MVRVKCSHNLNGALEPQIYKRLVVTAVNCRFSISFPSLKQILTLFIFGTKINLIKARWQAKIASVSQRSSKICNVSLWKYKKLFYPSWQVEKSQICSLHCETLLRITLGSVSCLKLDHTVNIDLNFRQILRLRFLRSCRKTLWLWHNEFQK